MNSFIFPNSYVGSFKLKACVADEKVVDCAEIDETFSAIVTGMFFDLFSYFDVPFPS